MTISSFDDGRPPLSMIFQNAKVFQRSRKAARRWRTSISCDHQKSYRIQQLTKNCFDDGRSQGSLTCRKSNACNIMHSISRQQQQQQQQQLVRDPQGLPASIAWPCSRQQHRRSRGRRQRKPVESTISRARTVSQS